jgi:DNA-binding GntR family transcriptional regulator
MEPYKGATVKPLSPEEAFDIADLRLALITLAAKPAYRRLSPADFDLACGLAKQMTRTNSAAAFGILYSKKPNGLFFGRCCGNWTTD